MAIKTHKVTLSLDNPRVIQSGINVQSFDKQSIQISIELTKNDEVFQVPSDATIRISLLKLANQSQRIIVDVPNTNRESIDWIVPDYLDGYQGVVRVGVYLSGVESVDLGYFTILSNVSDIDKMAEGFFEDVFNGWQGIEDELQSLNIAIDNANVALAEDLTQLDAIMTDVATKQSDVTSKYNAFDTSVTQAGQTIDDILALQPQFQAVLDETTGKDVISAPEIILARDGAQTLGERLDSDKAEVSAQLSQKANQSFVDSQFSSIVSGAPKGTYTDVASLQNAYPSGAEGIFLVLQDGHWYYWNGASSAWVSGGIYQSTGIADGSVASNKLEGTLRNYFNSVGFSSITWKNKGLLAADGTETADRNDRIVSSFISTPKNSVIKNNNQSIFDISIFVYEKDTYNFISETGWLTNDKYVVSDECLIRIVMKRDDGSQITIGASDNLEIDNNLVNMVKNNVENVNSILNSFDIEWTNENVSPSTGEVLGSASHRILTSLFSAPYGTEIVNNEPSVYDMTIYKYKDGIFLGDTGWLQESNYFIYDNIEARVMVRRESEQNLSTGESVYFNILNSTPQTNNKNVNNLMINNQTALFNKADIISDWKTQKMAHCAAIYADDYLDDGTFWGVYYANDVIANEHPDNLNTYINLVKFNVCDPSDFQTWRVVDVGQTFGDFTQGNKAPYDPNLIIEQNTVKVLFSAYGSAGATLGFVEFDKTTETFYDTFTPCSIKYDLNGTDNIVPFDVNGITQCYEDKGHVLESGLGTDVILFTSALIEKDGYLYGSLGMAGGGNFRGMILRSQDGGVTWEFFVIPDSSIVGSVLECNIEFIGNKMYYITRSKYLCVYDISTNTWENYFKLNDLVDSKVNVFNFNGELYIAYNKIKNLTTDWTTVIRNCMTIKKVKPNDITDIREVLEVQLEDGIHYYSFEKHKGSLYMVFSNDRRKLNYIQVNSNISFMPVKL